MTRKPKKPSVVHDSAFAKAIEVAYDAADSIAIENAMRLVAIKILAAALKVAPKEEASDAAMEVMQQIAMEAVENIVKGSGANQKERKRR